MKPTKTKKDIRDEINKQIDDFLKSGGAVDNIERGVSGNESNLNLFKQTSTFEPKQTRTPLNDVVKELDERKNNKNSPASKPKKKPKKVLLTDDFGEPIRWVWEE